MIKLCGKFEVPMSAAYEDVKGTQDVDSLVLGS